MNSTRKYKYLYLNDYAELNIKLINIQYFLFFYSYDMHNRFFFFFCYLYHIIDI